jgi:predicted N-acetyltransferase YhbS
MALDFTIDLWRSAHSNGRSGGEVCMARKMTKTTTKKAATKAAKKTTKKSAKKAAKKAVKKKTAKTATKAAAKKTVKKATKKAAKKATKKATKQAAKKTTKQAAKKTTKKAASKKTAKKTARKASKAVARKAPAKAAKQTTKQANKQATKQQANKQAKAPKNAPDSAAKSSPASRPAAAQPGQRARRAPSRLSANRRAGARKPESHEALAVRAVSEPPKRAPRKDAKTTQANKTARTAKKGQAKKPAPAKSERGPKAARAPKTARARIEARGAGKAGSSQLGNARTPVSRATAARQTGGGARKPPFRLNALGLREEHATDSPRIEMLLRAAQEAQARGALSVEALTQLRAQGEIAAALVAEYDDALVGHVVLARVTAPGPRGEAMAAQLASLVVDEALRGLGVDAQLLSAALEQARAAGVRLLLAEGEAELLAALGFAPGAAEGDLLTLALEGPDDADEQSDGAADEGRAGEP